MIIVNYVKRVETLREIKKFIGKYTRPLIFCGICTQDGLKNIDDILKVILLSSLTPISERIDFEFIEKYKSFSILIYLVDRVI